MNLDVGLELNITGWTYWFHNIQTLVEINVDVIVCVDYLPLCLLRTPESSDTTNTHEYSTLSTQVLFSDVTRRCKLRYLQWLFRMLKWWTLFFFCTLLLFFAVFLQQVSNTFITTNEICKRKGREMKALWSILRTTPLSQASLFLPSLLSQLKNKTIPFSSLLWSQVWTYIRVQAIRNRQKSPEILYMN